ncbi:(2Fe-2S) ferredoxin domain-containing protein [Sphingomonas sp. AOB5]|uniref:(2Fe-2S) ferredoxin domain-containing protein n=1 Tax=Sphingomonas sp. AOB5 TaxID=3034017 RepID=UPI0023FA2C27|nr:(2Fe-2S) ferredoxin domain-containing protein [Sphingomonas sp. AOB5]MDF7776772.1 (2Fe-2S) ferredoxin domain-containing protein [Sphingomonas sp. AOB5]
MRLFAANWSHTVQVCAKCTKRLGGGFGPRRRTPLAKTLRNYLKSRKDRGRGTGIVETRCMGVCPRGAVTVLNGAESRDWLLIPAGTPVEAVAEALKL